MSKQPPRVQLNFEPDYEPPPMQEKPDVDINIKDVDVQEEMADIMPEVVEKEKINEKDIFDNIPDEVNEETGEKNPNFIYEEPKPKPVKVKKPRKPMSEEHKKKLALAREKAMAVRKAKAEEKKKMKALENEEKELLKTQKIKKVQKLKKEVEEEEQPKETKQDNRIPADLINLERLSNALTKKDLEDAQYEAIVKYETLRKQRKAIKKEEEMKEKQKKELLSQLKPQQYKYRDGSNRWDMCY
jgi:hypothetical protein